RLWTELYFQTVHDPAVAPVGVHTMSVFAQYVPHTFARGTWNSRRDEVKSVALESIGRFCQNIPEDVMNVQVLGPPDIEEAVGLTGLAGSFGARRGSSLPRRLPPRLHVGKAALAEDPYARRLPLRRMHSPGRKCDRDQRPQRGRGGAAPVERDHLRST